MISTLKRKAKNYNNNSNKNVIYFNLNDLGP